MKVLITGANGFVGKALGLRLLEAGHCVCGAIRPNAPLAPGIEARPAAHLSASGDWNPAVTGCEAVVHLAARVHVMHDTSTDPLAEFRAANVAGTLRLAEQAAAAGLGHLVFLSSIKANGEETFGTPFGPDNAAPVDPYGISKLEAERGLAEIAARTGLAVTVLRPPLVYGPGVKGNFRSLIGLVDRGVPLPLGAIHNRRSLIGLGNLTDAIRACLDQPPGAGQCRVFTLADGEALSSPDLVRRLARALGRPARLLPVPVGLMRFAGRLAGKTSAVQRLTASLEVESGTMAAMIGWSAPMTLDEGLDATAHWWRNKEKTS
ncbi:Divinyl protochlorophyllide a 8-vinyl-reductase [Paramagnetospirillum magnetotacticum MS-1]|uniref:Divinyl protochlorophyllide a 8-vinyl-reductase n=1 Tax=Paramagnetospirillum magnetotacticum MS-1 TaxID=272627 RepID=A0A0C2YSX1_PARME|nr:SDR family oxidoreductase [Paramagnetospirillum magnetotacticum]KIL97820.1 Divinyl protochlorophyllide a 8-vinyl-reductase [Paramagnetospirillum magnetotacticum MS-1]